MLIAVPFHASWLNVILLLWNGSLIFVSVIEAHKHTNLYQLSTVVFILESSVVTLYNLLGIKLIYLTLMIFLIVKDCQMWVTFLS